MIESGNIEALDRVIAAAREARDRAAEEFSSEGEARKYDGGGGVDGA